MAKYTNGYEIVEAVQYTEGNPVIFSNSVLKISHGDWIITRTNGTQEVVSDRTFRENERCGYIQKVQE